MYLYTISEKDLERKQMFSQAEQRQLIKAFIWALQDAIQTQEVANPVIKEMKENQLFACKAGINL